MTVDLREPLTVVYASPGQARPEERRLTDGTQYPARGDVHHSPVPRDHFAELEGIGSNASVWPFTQTTEYQREAAERLHLPFPLLSDHSLLLRQPSAFQTFQAGGLTLLKRLTMIIETAFIKHVFYPVHPRRTQMPSSIG